MVLPGAAKEGPCWELWGSWGEGMAPVPVPLHQPAPADRLP